MNTKTIACGLMMFIALSNATPLNNPILKLLDGIPFALDGATIWDMMRIRLNIKKIQFGVLNQETQHYQGKYFFKGAWCTLHDLAEYEIKMDMEFQARSSELDMRFMNEHEYQQFQQELLEILEKLEQQYEQEYTQQQEVIERTLEEETQSLHEQLTSEEVLYERYRLEALEREEYIKRAYVHDYEQYQEEAQVLKAEQELYRKELEPIFIMAKEDVLKVLTPFSKKISGAKKFLYKLVEEFSQKRHKPKSFLLNWSTIPDGHEFVIFNKTMVNCKILDEFATDLTLFLKDVIESCPKGWQQFLELSKPKR